MMNNRIWRLLALASLLLGLSMALSSTAMVMQLLVERGQMSSRAGRTTISAVSTQKKNRPATSVGTASSRLMFVKRCRMAFVIAGYASDPRRDSGGASHPSATIAPERF